MDRDTGRRPDTFPAVENRILASPAGKDHNEFIGDYQAVPLLRRRRFGGSVRLPQPLRAVMQMLNLTTVLPGSHGRATALASCYRRQIGGYCLDPQKCASDVRQGNGAKRRFLNEMLLLELLGQVHYTGMARVVVGASQGLIGRSDAHLDGHLHG